jgi:hypothetical protein
MIYSARPGLCLEERIAASCCNASLLFSECSLLKKRDGTFGTCRARADSSIPEKKKIISKRKENPDGKHLFARTPPPTATRWVWIRNPGH